MITVPYHSCIYGPLASLTVAPLRSAPVSRNPSWRVSRNLSPWRRGTRLQPRRPRPRSLLQVPPLAARSGAALGPRLQRCCRCRRHRHRRRRRSLVATQQPRRHWYQHHLRDPKLRRQAQSPARRGELSLQRSAPPMLLAPAHRRRRAVVRGAMEGVRAGQGVRHSAPQPWRSRPIAARPAARRSPRTSAPPTRQQEQAIRHLAAGRCGPPPLRYDASRQGSPSSAAAARTPP